MTIEKNAEELLARCVRLANEKKAREMISLQLKPLTLICDYFLIMSAGSNRQAQALADHIVTEMKAAGEAPLRIEGYREGQWILLDFGAVVVHIFQEDERAYYDLERLWGDAEKIEH